MKKIVFIIALISTILLGGCNKGDVSTAIVWYVENGTLGYLPDDALYKPVENEKTKALSTLAEEHEQPFEIVFKCYGRDLLPSNIDFIDTLKKKDNEFDIVTFNPMDYSKYLPLEEELEKKEFNQLKQIIPDNAWDIHEINGHQYQVPKPMVYLLQPNFYLYKDYINEKGIDVSIFQEDYTEVMKHMIELAEADAEINKTYNLTDSGLLSLQVLNQNQYKSITDISDHFFEGLLIRKNDHKVVNLYEIEELKDQLSINQQVYSKNLDGHTVNSDLPYILSLSYSFPKEYENEDEQQIFVPIKMPYGAQSIGYGIVEDSKHASEALQALQFIYTNHEASNLLIYGIEGVDYTLKDGKAITTKENTRMRSYGTFAKLGNNLIAYPSEVEPLNKKELAQTYNEQLIVDKSENFVPDFHKIQDTYEDITAIYRDTLVGLNYHVIEDIDVYYAQANEKLYAAGLQEVIDEMQRQYDAYLEEVQ